MSYRKRRRKQGRRPSFREPKRLWLIVCEGLTEKHYLTGFHQRYRTAEVTLQLEINGQSGDPSNVVKVASELRDNSVREAKSQRDENLAFDAVWCIVDVNDHTQLANAIETARDRNIELVISDPCFELWLLLHLTDPPGAQTRHRIQERLLKIIRETSPNMTAECLKRLTINQLSSSQPFEKLYQKAVMRAKQLMKLARGERRRHMNPSTDVYRLTEAIRGVLSPEF
jgi:hypothetical protein